VSTPLREAASVILLRRGKGTAPFEVFFLRRHRNASFMASAYVFPGGGADPGEDARACAARELFEEAGVLLARAARVPNPSSDDTSTLGHSDEALSLSAIRKKALAGASATKLLASLGMEWWTDVLAPWSHWITPSSEQQLHQHTTSSTPEAAAKAPKRFSARFFVAEMPSGQKPSFDSIETVDQVWVTPADGLARAGELNLPPPQIRTLWELSAFATVDEVLAAAKVRADEPHPILPRRLGDAMPPVLLLPWDPQYVEGGVGDSAPLTYQPAWAVGPSRFVREGDAWTHITAP
jgi:8-oxo-dGTP pyrophosphatase MutT (NUDIX family)